MVGYLNAIGPTATKMRALANAMAAAPGVPALAATLPTITSYPESQSDSSLSVSYSLTYNTNRDKVYSGGGQLVAYSGGGLKGASVNTGANVGTGAFQQSIFHETETDAPQIEFTFFRQGTTRADIYIRDTPTSPWRSANDGLVAFNTSETSCCLKIAFSGAGAGRGIRVGLAYNSATDSGTAAVLTRIRVSAGYAAQAPANRTSPLKACVFGDSFIQSAFYNIPYFLEWECNLEITASGVGGTGWVATSGGTQIALKDRIASDSLLADYDLYIIAMGVNDGGQSGITAAVSAGIAALKANGTDKPIIIVTPWDANAPSAMASSIATARDQIKAATRGVLGVHVCDPTSVTYEQSDGLHPTRPGGALTLSNWLMSEFSRLAHKY